MTPAAALRLALFFLGLFLSLGFHQGLTVADRDLVVVGMDFGEGEEAVPVAAVVDEGRLQRGFDPGHLGKIDVAAKLFLAGGFEIEFLDSATLRTTTRVSSGCAASISILLAIIYSLEPEAIRGCVAHAHDAPRSEANQPTAWCSRRGVGKKDGAAAG